MFKFLIRKQRGIFRIYIGLRWQAHRGALYLARRDYQALSSTAYTQLFKECHPTAAQAQGELLRIKSFMCEQGHSFCAKPKSLPPGVIRLFPSPRSQAEKLRKKLLRSSVF